MVIHQDKEVQDYIAYKDNLDVLFSSDCRHHFVEQQKKKSEKKHGQLLFKCKNCGGEIGSRAFYWYSLGLKHGGGNKNGGRKAK